MTRSVPSSSPNNTALLAAARRERVEEFGAGCRNLVRFLTAQRDQRTGTDTEAAELERQRAASKIRQWVDNETRMHHTHIEFDPVRGAKLNKALADMLRRHRSIETNAGVPWNQLEVDSFLNGIDRAVTTPGSHRPAPTTPPAAAMTNVDGSTVKPETSTGRLQLRSRCRCSWFTGGSADPRDRGHHRPAHPARRAARTQHLRDLRRHPHPGVPGPANVLRRQHHPLRPGRRRRSHRPRRSTRTTSRAQRRKLRAIHKTCVGDNCHVSFEQCEIHHVIFWRFEGRTDISNLVPVCSKHHHLAHEGGWTLSMTPDRTVTWTRPDGTIHSIHDSNNRTPPRTRNRTRQRRRTPTRRSDRTTTTPPERPHDRGLGSAGDRPRVHGRPRVSAVLYHPLVRMKTCSNRTDRPSSATPAWRRTRPPAASASSATSSPTTPGRSSTCRHRSLSRSAPGRGRKHRGGGRPVRPGRARRRTGGVRLGGRLRARQRRGVGRARARAVTGLGGEFAPWAGRPRCNDPIRPAL